METRICKHCGKELPTECFFKTKYGLSTICRNCQGEKIRQGLMKKKQLDDKNAEVEIANAKKSRLADFTPRELMEELHRRGYSGKLEYTETHVIDITNLK